MGNTAMHVNMAWWVYGGVKGISFLVIQGLEYTYVLK
jgi:hypothetical protein